MSRYFFIRVISIIPTLVIISFFAFFLSKNVAQDPVEAYLGDTANILNENLQYEKSEEYKRTYAKLGLNKASFYFTVVPNSYPEGYSKLYKLEKDLLRKHHEGFFLPSFRWHGLDNQYHDWVKKILTLDFGKSILDGRSVASKISKALSWTLLLVILSLFFVSIFGVVLGVFSTEKNPSNFIKGIHNVLYFTYAMPVFWLGTLMIIFFTTDEYGSWTNIFPSVEINFGATGFFQKIKILILPIIIICLHKVSFLARQMRNSIIREKSLPYSLTATAKGLGKNETIQKHNFNNALLPMITILTSMIPSAFSGSLIIEVIFGIPGIGRLMYGSILAADWNIVFGLLILIGFITVISYLIGDLLYAFVNPKIKYGKQFS